MSDDELLALARDVIKVRNGPANIDRLISVLEPFEAAITPTAIIALIERHRAEVERLTRENNKAAGTAAYHSTKRVEAELRAEAAESALAAVRAEQRACKASAIAGPKESTDAKG